MTLWPGECGQRAGLRRRGHEALAAAGQLPRQVRVSRRGGGGGQQGALPPPLPPPVRAQRQAAPHQRPQRHQVHRGQEVWGQEVTLCSVQPRQPRPGRARGAGGRLALRGRDGQRADPVMRGAEQGAASLWRVTCHESCAGAGPPAELQLRRHRVGAQLAAAAAPRPLRQLARVRRMRLQLGRPGRRAPRQAGRQLTVREPGKNIYTMQKNICSIPRSLSTWVAVGDVDEVNSQLPSPHVEMIKVIHYSNKSKLLQIASN